MLEFSHEVGRGSQNFTLLECLQEIYCEITTPISRGWLYTWQILPKVLKNTCRCRQLHLQTRRITISAVVQGIAHVHLMMHGIFQRTGRHLVLPCILVLTLWIVWLMF